jgi:hypothetical protein
MTKNELSERLRHLDPGATCTVDEAELARMFDAEALTRDAVAMIEFFALEHRCTFSYHERGVTSPCFEKDDIF